MAMSDGVSAPARIGGRTEPAATRCSRRRALSSMPNGGWPSRQVYSVAPSEKTSLASLISVP
jgi:hypothetical protein